LYQIPAKKHTPISATKLFSYYLNNVYTLESYQLFTSNNN